MTDGQTVRRSDGQTVRQTESIIANTALCIARAMLTRCKNLKKEVDVRHVRVARRLCSSSNSYQHTEHYATKSEFSTCSKKFLYHTAQHYTRSSATAEKQRVSCPHGGVSPPANSPSHGPRKWRARRGLAPLQYLRRGPFMLLAPPWKMTSKLLHCVMYA